MISQAFIEEMKTKLLALKEQLTSELSGLPSHTEIDTDPEATADEAEQDFDNQGIRLQIQEDLKNIEAALERIEAGTYGLDADGREISEERLRVLPWADKAL